MKDMSGEFRKLVLGKGGGKKKTVRKRAKRGNWAIPSINHGKVAPCRRCKRTRIKHTSSNYGICPKCHRAIDYITRPQNESERSLYR